MEERIEKRIDLVSSLFLVAGAILLLIAVRDLISGSEVARYAWITIAVSMSFITISLVIEKALRKSKKG